MAVRTVIYSPQFPAVPWPYPHGGVALNVGTNDTAIYYSGLLRCATFWLSSLTAPSPLLSNRAVATNCRFGQRNRRIVGR